MNINEFKVGDRVVMVGNYFEYDASFASLGFTKGSGTVDGDTGTICGILSEAPARIFHVKWDREIKGGHDCDGNCKFGYGWNVSARMIRVIDETCHDYEPPTPNDLRGLLGIG